MKPHDYDGKVLTQGQWVARPPTDKPIAAVCVPAGDQVQLMTAFSLFCMGIATRSANLMPAFRSGQDPAQSRNETAKIVIEHGADWVLFIDSDMTFPGNALDRLIAHDKDIVGADYRKRAPPYSIIGHPDTGFEPTGSGLAPYRMLGLGLLLVRRRVFFTIKRPWFKRHYEPNDFGTEDWHFCDQAEKAGLKVWCDLDLTKEVCHLGQHAVPWDIPGSA